jgi:hypothetical protein
MPSNYWMIEENELRVKGSGRCPFKVTTSVFAWSDEGNIPRIGMRKIEWALYFLVSSVTTRELLSFQTTRYGKSVIKSQIRKKFGPSSKLVSAHRSQKLRKGKQAYGNIRDTQTAFTYSSVTLRPIRFNVTRPVVKLTLYIYIINDLR